ncbi:hypothetical protein SAMN04488503_1133 [Humidesulfovibrio mexicanus]|uniref:HPt domain-containing protein n=1 Tax=Humidesulfovibrio mexicanus TaxID=147047 RepID=A0A238YZZ8_9BACT|nr:hypothetical protein [Humidesulfovibrio mexicanus]SNR76690.1 hypothetical protein SAMN04488503_1133 [Humidesulfovibrio mexicanus]
MSGEDKAAGIDLASLEEAFSGSEDVLAQMLGLFVEQATERVELLDMRLAGGDQAGARTLLHSLINISGAVRAYAMSELAKAVGDAVKADDREAALARAALLRAEAGLVIGQARALLAAAGENPADMWKRVRGSL